MNTSSSLHPEIVPIELQNVLKQSCRSLAITPKVINSLLACIHTCKLPHKPIYRVSPHPFDIAVFDSTNYSFTLGDYRGMYSFWVLPLRAG